jgi:hypothetical protein
MWRTHASGKKFFITPDPVLSSLTMGSSFSDRILHHLNFRIAMVLLERGCSGQEHSTPRVHRDLGDAQMNAVL